MKKVAIILIGVSLISGCSLMKPAITVKPGQTEQKFSGKVTRDVSLGYQLYIPENYVSTDPSPWPLVLFLHGSGERGNDLSKVAVHGPARLAKEGKAFPFILVSPQCPDGQWWNAEDLMALLKDIQSKYRVDENRIYITGLSMGGYGTWDLISKYPGVFAAAVPVCGGGDPRMVRFAVKTPVWAFHGEKDNVVNPQESKDLVDALLKAGGNAKLTLYPEAGHDSWTETYNNPEVYTWLLNQKKEVVKE